jgi:hypothetical protein
MKIEIGESLMLSYLKHVKKCIFYQTNWKVSSKWHISTETLDKVQFIYDKIIKHSEFADIFKYELNQLIKQAEIDVIGLDSNDCVYACDIAFHEAGLNYGSKIETKNRVFKKLLRSYLTLLAYFPNKKYELMFASPKVNQATEVIISDYLNVLQKDFTNEYVVFKYVSNNNFYENILKPTILDSTNDSDTNELFIRSIILNNLFESKNQTIHEVVSLEKTQINTVTNYNDDLILEFEPSNQRLFEHELIRTKQARRIIFYKNNRIENHIWNANNFTERSSLIGNIRSNNLIRRWRELGIVKIRFEIIDN